MSGRRARKEAAAERTASAWPSMAEGAGWGAVKPVTVTSAGTVAARECKHAAVMLGVLLGFTRRMEIWREEVPVIEGSGGAGVVGLGLGSAEAVAMTAGWRRKSVFSCDMWFGGSEE